MRRGLGGIGAIQKQKLAQSKYKDKGNEIAHDQMQQMSKQLDVFREKLEEFAKHHKNDIKKDSQFRKQFQEMCASIGVDPLASGKGFWAEKLGFGDFYYELGVQIIEVCLATNHRNGGLIYLDDLRSKLLASRSVKNKDDITNDDLLRAIKKLKALGNGFSVISVGNGKYMVQSVPGELSMDHTSVLEHVQNEGFATVSSLQDHLKWDSTRASNILERMVKEGMVWIDCQGSETSYWFPGLFQSSAS